MPNEFKLINLMAQARQGRDITLVDQDSTQTLTNKTSGGVFKLASGSVTAPSLTFSSDSVSDTGLYWAGEDTMGLIAAGTEVVRLTGAGTNYAATARIAFGSDGVTGIDTMLYRNAAGVLALRNDTSAQTFVIGAAGAATAAIALNGSGVATSAYKLIKKVTGIADNTATDVLTVTIPNANHAAGIQLTFVSSNGSTDAFESSRIATGYVVVARTTGANAVTTAAAIGNAAIATVAAGATHTLAYAVSAITGAAGASNSFTVQVTIDDSGNVGSNQVVVLAEVINSEATGVTIA